MTYRFCMMRWLPLTILVASAIAFEPVRSGFEFANQICELSLNWDRVRNATSNLRHIVGYGVICFVAAATLRQNRILIATTTTFILSVLLEIEQSFFRTGHCRAWDLIPNVLGIGLAAAFFWVGIHLVNRLWRVNSNE